ncbi:MAG: tetratricopeptide repeat protein, partial [Bacteroidetes bacterium]|nr:tetratricopeptide repeat protein [Bacteroidota bacterium]
MVRKLLKRVLMLMLKNRALQILPKNQTSFHGIQLSLTRISNLIDMEYKMNRCLKYIVYSNCSRQFNEENIVEIEVKYLFFYILFLLYSMGNALAQNYREVSKTYELEGLAEFNREHYQASLESYNKALKYDSLNPDIIKGRGDALFELRQCTEAIEAFNLAIEQYKKLPDTNVNKIVKLERTYEARGYAKLCIKDCQNAVYDFDHVLKKIPNSQRSYLGKGNAFRCLEKYDSALFCYNPLISLNPKVSDFFSERGECFYHLGRYYEAICDLNRYEFLTKSSNEKMNPLANFYRADCYFKLQKYDSAILDFEKTLLEYKSNSGVWVQLGDAYIFNDDFSNSRMCYERALDIDPQSIKAHKSMGRWELSQS